ncbi:unnamed protein product [Rhizophagus irregularis]|uniref:Uncharacterized protein n=1 Tax=Rhizophagus irregularis TaxID=588596 RepID=A0A915ZMD2_9GLOM|nr:unnamed protein product [Rhizophagus irregularis]
MLPDPFRPSDTISDCSFRTLLDRWHYFRPTGGSGIPVCLGNINVINLRKKGVKEDSSSFAIHLFSILFFNKPKLPNIQNLYSLLKSGIGRNEIHTCDSWNNSLWSDSWVF